MRIDIDPETIAIARILSAGNADVEFHSAALTEVAGTGYDVVTAIAVVHHLDLSEALTAMRRLTKPGGKLLIVGCYRSATASDYHIDVVAIPAGSVLATDLSPTILKYAAQAAQAAGVDNLSTLELDGEILHQLPVGSYDAAISRLGLIYFPNRHEALTGIQQSLRKGGRFAAVTYSTAATNGFFSLPVSIISKRAQLPQPSPGQPGPFSLADPEVLDQDLTKAGFHDIKVEVIDAPVRLTSAAECTRFERESFGALHQMLSTMTFEDQNTVWDEIESALGQFETDDGFIGPCELVIVGATR